ncbi:hypothetical protein SAY86_028939 [Trapa natans]|uniref:RING-type domain-containing protein n=1 Tax=Trapa natans TaxID=22666 RepID=A0AAN7MJS8_TRANT|nr:hypothetical protein SAY86_028939 [Trapa natans]
MMGLNIKNTAMGMAKSVALTPLKALLHLCFFFLSLILARSGLLRVQPPPGRREGETSEEPPTLNDLYVLVMDGGAPSLVHVRVLTSHFKNRVPVVEFGELVERRHGVAGGGGAEEAAECAVCLSRMEKSDEMRDLRRCSHVFHRRCLDRWVDLGHVTCPLCRSWLLSPPFSYEARN